MSQYFEQTTGRTAVLIKLQPRYYDTKQNGVFVKTVYILSYAKTAMLHETLLGSVSGRPLHW